MSYFFFEDRRYPDSNVTGHGAAYFSIELQGVNVDLISSSVMNMFVLKFLFMTDSIYLLLITTPPPPPQKNRMPEPFPIMQIPWKLPLFPCF
jgi:hypothetical protein